MQFNEIDSLKMLIIFGLLPHTFYSKYKQKDFKFESTLNNLVNKHDKINSIRRNLIITQNRVLVALPEAMRLIPHTLEDDTGEIMHCL